MTTTPFFAYDWMVLEAGAYLLTSSTALAAMIAAVNTRWGNQVPLAEIDDAAVEVGLEEDDAASPPQARAAARLNLLRSRIDSRSGPAGRARHDLQVRVFARTAELIDPAQLPHLAGKGWLATAASMRVRLLGRTVTYELERALIGAKLPNPASTEDAPLEPLCTGIYNVSESEGPRVDRPVPGDLSLLRATYTMTVWQKVRSGVGGWTPT